MIFARRFLKLIEKISHAFRVSPLHPSINVQVLDSHTVANALEVLVDQE